MYKRLLPNCLPMSFMPEFRLSIFACAVAAGLSGCVDVPELDKEIAPDLRGAGYPALVPIEAALAEGANPAQSAEDIDAELAARRAGLERRANALRNPVLDENSRQRLQETVGE